MHGHSQMCRVRSHDNRQKLVFRQPPGVIVGDGLDDVDARRNQFANCSPGIVGASNGQILLPSRSHRQSAGQVTDRRVE